MYYFFSSGFLHVFYNFSNAFNLTFFPVYTSLILILMTVESFLMRFSTADVMMARNTKKIGYQIIGKLRLQNVKNYKTYELSNL